MTRGHHRDAATHYGRGRSEGHHLDDERSALPNAHAKIKPLRCLHNARSEFRSRKPTASEE